MRSDLKKLMFHLDAGMWHGSATETVWVEPIGGGRFRLENTPFYAFGVSYQDIVAAREEDGMLVFDGVVAKGGHSTYRIIRMQDAEAFRKYWEPLQEIGCTYEEGLNDLLSVDVPPSTDIYVAYELLEQGEQAGVWSFEEGHCGHELNKQNS